MDASRETTKRLAKDAEINNVITDLNLRALEPGPSQNYRKMP
jgi:hypothetical protein